LLVFLSMGAVLSAEPPSWEQELDSAVAGMAAPAKPAPDPDPFEMLQARANERTTCGGITAMGISEDLGAEDVEWLKEHAVRLAQHELARNVKHRADTFCRDFFEEIGLPVPDDLFDLSIVADHDDEMSLSPSYPSFFRLVAGFLMYDAMTLKPRSGDVVVAKEEGGKYRVYVLLYMDPAELLLTIRRLGRQLSLHEFDRVRKSQMILELEDEVRSYQVYRDEDMKRRLERSEDYKFLWEPMEPVPSP